MTQQERSRPCPMSSQHQANAISNTPTIQGPCYKCGGSHYLRNCPNDTPEERDRIYRQYGVQMRSRTSHISNHREQNSHQQRGPTFQTDNNETTGNGLVNSTISQQHRPEHKLIQHSQQLSIQQ